MIAAIWPELLVAVLFLAGDLIWDGTAAGVAGLAAGVLSFLALLPFHRRKPGLMVEGALFGIMAFLGAGLIHIEAVLGALLLLSAAFRWNLPGRMAGGMLKGILGEEGTRLMSLSMGTVFILHAGAFAVLEREGLGGTLNGAVLFAALYIPALVVTSRRLRRIPRGSRPVISALEDGTAVLLSDGSEVLSFRLCIPGERIASVEFLRPKVPGHRIVGELSRALSLDGYGTMKITGWEGDALDLEMDGFRETRDGWAKRLVPFHEISSR